MTSYPHLPYIFFGPDNVRIMDDTAFRDGYLYVFGTRLGFDFGVHPNVGHDLVRDGTSSDLGQSVLKMVADIKHVHGAMPVEQRYGYVAAFQIDAWVEHDV